MNDRLLAALFVLATWWSGTAVVLMMVWLRRSTFRASMAASSVLAIAGLYGLWSSSRIESPHAAYVAFGCAIVVWGWHELTFLLGVITGPRKTECPPRAKGWERFRAATAAVLHHEVALALTLAWIVATTWGQPNQVGAQTFCVMWVMRLSAKFNVFLGVRNLTEQFVPPHLRYMLSYFRRARMNALMPFSLLVGGLVAVRLLQDALSTDAASFVGVGRTLVASILGLAVVEHAFLSLPVPDAILWRWAVRAKSHEPKLSAEAR
jgi:putative photosynthetic complex assembly protein 2